MTPKPYTDKAIKSELRRQIRLHPREKLDDALLRYIKENFVPILSEKRGDHVQAKTKTVISIVCKYFGMSLEQLKVKGRKRQLCYSRQVLHFYLATRTSMQLVEIGDLFSQDHTTVMASRNKIINLYKKNPTVRLDVDQINELLPKREAEQRLQKTKPVKKKAKPPSRPAAIYSNARPYDSLHQTQKSA